MKTGVALAGKKEELPHCHLYQGEMGADILIGLLLSLLCLCKTYYAKVVEIHQPSFITSYELREPFENLLTQISTQVVIVHIFVNLLDYTAS